MRKLGLVALFIGGLALLPAVAIVIVGIAAVHPSLDLFGSAQIHRPLQMVPQHGRFRGPIAFRDNPTVSLFGSTTCEPCKANLRRLSELLAALGSEADRVNVFFITTDPAHDTSAVLRTFLRNYDHHIVGVTGRGSETLGETYFRAFRGVPIAKARLEAKAASRIFLIEKDSELNGTFDLSQPLDEGKQKIVDLIAADP